MENDTSNVEFSVKQKSNYRFSLVDQGKNKEKEKDINNANQSYQLNLKEEK